MAYTKFTLIIELGNEEMETRDDVAKVLTDVAKRLTTSINQFGIIMDTNGNSVGEFMLESEATAAVVRSRVLESAVSTHVAEQSIIGAKIAEQYELEQEQQDSQADFDAGVDEAFQSLDRAKGQEHHYVDDRPRSYPFIYGGGGG